MEHYIDAFKNFATIEGRATRTQFWMFALFNFVISFVCGIVDGVTGYPVLGLLYTLVALVPGITIGIRRLHDTGRSGWWLLIALVPLIGIFALLFFYVSASAEDNEYGPNPYGGKADA